MREAQTRPPAALAQVADPTAVPIHPGPHRNDRAYAFYATGDAHAVAVLVFTRLLRRLGIQPGIDLLALHHSVSVPLVEAMGRAGITPRPVEPIRGARGYFRDSLTKLRVFELTEYERVVFLDADAVPLQPLDRLFELDDSAAVAAPSAYWLPQPRWTTALFALRPSAELRARIAERVRTARRERRVDMDVVNAELRGEIHTLEPNSFWLNAEWEDLRRPAPFDDRDRAFAQASVIHFTALGKPWSHSSTQVRRRRPHAHPAFYELFELWHRARLDVRAILRA